jgi:transcriptional regulator with GAF, ATPase, and Fis domain
VGTQQNITSADNAIVGTSPPMMTVRDEIARAGARVATVLILGETGTGKELVARAIHQCSHQNGARFLAINCAGIPDQLLESELFGHEKGAFTGAVHHIGKFEQCDGGTLLLDEIGDMALGAQAKILRVLQEGQFERIGGDTTINVDVRIIAATNKNLYEMVQNGHFRKDLFYRLNVLNIDLPPLRDRGDDVILLAEHFLATIEPRQNTSRIVGLTVAAKDWLRRYPWPGNVRELGNVIERAIAAGNVDENGLLDPACPIAPYPSSSNAAAPSSPAQTTFVETTRNLADIVFNDLLRGQAPQLGLRQGAKGLGQLAISVLDAIVLGFQQYLDSDQGAKDLTNYRDGHFISRLGLPKRRGRSGESVFNTELRRRVAEVLAVRRNEQLRR